LAGGVMAIRPLFAAHYAGTLSRTVKSCDRMASVAATSSGAARVMQMTVDVDLVDADLEGFLLAAGLLTRLVAVSAFGEIGSMDGCVVGARRYCSALSRCSVAFGQKACERMALAFGLEDLQVRVSARRPKSIQPVRIPQDEHACLTQFDREVA
jgi:hypothetical protein